MPVHKPIKGRNATDLRPPSEIDARFERLPSSRVKLTAAERKLLKDPDWIDQDEADLILALREEKEYKPSDCISFREYLRRQGRVVKMGVSSKTDVAGEPWKLILSSRAYSDLGDILEAHGDGAYDEALSDLLALEETLFPNMLNPQRNKSPFRIYIYLSLYRGRTEPSIYRGFDRW